MTVIESKPIAGERGVPSSSRVLVLLAGGAAPSPLARALGCSLLDVEIAPGTALLNWWCDRDWALGDEPRHVRIVRGAGSRAPTSQPTGRGVVLTQRVDDAGPRGSAGALRDATEGDDPDTTVVAVESSSAVVAPLEPLLARHAESGADVSVVCTSGGRAAGMAILRREALDQARPRGYVDLKEQLIPALLRGGRRIHVLRVAESQVVSMHERRGMLDAIARVRAADASALASSGRPLMDPRWRPSVVAPTAEVAGSALLSGSLVMAHARVGDGAIVARSIVAPGAWIQPGRVVLDAIVTPMRTYFDEQLPRESRKEGR